MFVAHGPAGILGWLGPDQCRMRKTVFAALCVNSRVPIVRRSLPFMGSSSQLWRIVVRAIKKAQKIFKDTGVWPSIHAVSVLLVSVMLCTSTVCCLRLMLRPMCCLRGSNLLCVRHCCTRPLLIFANGLPVSVYIMLIYLCVCVVCPSPPFLYLACHVFS